MADEAEAIREHVREHNAAFVELFAQVNRHAVRTQYAIDIPKYDRQRVIAAVLFGRLVMSTQAATIP
ncbi:MAG: hypothetical protein AB7G13_15485 [Lautropia sp.]